MQHLPFSRMQLVVQSSAALVSSLTSTTLTGAAPPSADDEDLVALLNAPCSVRRSGTSQQPLRSATWEEMPGEKRALPMDAALKPGLPGAAGASDSSSIGPAPTSSPQAVVAPLHGASEGAPGSSSARSGSWQAGQVAAAAPLGVLQATRASSSGGQQQQSGGGSSVEAMFSRAKRQTGHQGLITDLKLSEHSEEQPSAHKLTDGVSQQPAAEGARIMPSADEENVSPNRGAAGRGQAAGLGRLAHQRHGAGSASGSQQVPEAASGGGKELKGPGSKAGQPAARSAAGSAAHAGLQRKSGLQGISSGAGRRSQEKLSGIVSFLDQLEAQVI